MNGLGINKAPKNDKDADILTPDEVALLRTHASDGTLTAAKARRRASRTGLVLQRFWSPSP